MLITKTSNLGRQIMPSRSVMAKRIAKVTRQDAIVCPIKRNAGKVPMIDFKPVIEMGLFDVLFHEKTYIKLTARINHMRY